jgi:RNA polymerase sigma-70 factor (ECF subfamily)
VRRVALNLLNDARKRRRRRDAAYRRTGPPANAPELAATTVLIVEALRSIPAEQRQALALHYLLDMPVEQVAWELDRPVGTVKTRARPGAVGGSSLRRSTA